MTLKTQSAFGDASCLEVRGYSRASFSVLKIKETVTLLGHCRAIWLRTDIL